MGLSVEPPPPTSVRYRITAPPLTLRIFRARLELDCPPLPLKSFFRFSDSRAVALKLKSEEVNLRIACSRHEVRRSMAWWVANSSPSTLYTPVALFPQAQASTTTTAYLQLSPPSSATVPPYPSRGHHDAPIDEMVYTTAQPALALSEDSARELTAYQKIPCPDLAHNHNQPSEPFVLLEVNSAP